MSLDPTARESNVRDSLKKYFWDGMVANDGIHVSFDRWLTAPKVRGTEVDRWVGVKIGELDRATLSTLLVEFFCCSVRDPEGYRVAQVCDTLNGYLTDETQTDGMRRIPFYRSRETGAWTLLGALIVQEVFDGRELELIDGTKYKIVTAKVRFASKV